MKNLYFIGGTMGVGKTTVCRILQEKLNKSVFLDGDWCWDSRPFKVNNETKAMAEDNICHCLNNFIHCTAYDNVIFCWVMHEQKIIDNLLSHIDTVDCCVKAISLICTAKSLEERLQKDIDAGLRQPDILERSKSRIVMYENLNTVKIDVSGLSPEETAQRILLM